MSVYLYKKAPIFHQISSYNYFVHSSSQKTFDSSDDLVVTPDFNPSKEGDNELYRYASVKLDKVKLDKPKFWGRRRQHRGKKVRSDKFKTRNEEFLGKEILKEGDREVIIGKLPVMVKSNSCWMKEAEKDDCEFDHGGIFFALCASSDKEVVDLMNCSNDEARIHNILFAFVRDTDEKCRTL
ncbi:DNA-directed RNA polymerases IV and V subunit 2, partial [Mucuna pruriens]